MNSDGEIQKLGWDLNRILKDREYLGSNQGLTGGENRGKTKGWENAECMLTTKQSCVAGLKVEEAQGETKFREGRITESNSKRKTNNLYVQVLDSVCMGVQVQASQLQSAVRTQSSGGPSIPNPRTSIVPLKPTNRRVLSSLNTQQKTNSEGPTNS